MTIAAPLQMPAKTIVVIVPSASERYRSTWLFADINNEADDISSLLKTA